MIESSIIQAVNYSIDSIVIGCAISTTCLYFTENVNCLISKVNDILDMLIVGSTVCTIRLMAIVCDNILSTYSIKLDDWRTKCVMRNCNVNIIVSECNKYSWQHHFNVYMEKHHQRTIIVDIYFTTARVSFFQNLLKHYAVYLYHIRQILIITKTYRYLSFVDYMVNVSNVLFIRYEFSQSHMPYPNQLQDVLAFLSRHKITHYWLINEIHFMKALQPIVRIHEIYCRHVVKSILDVQLNQDISRIILKYIY